MERETTASEKKRKAKHAKLDARRRNQPRAPKTISPTYLERAALYHLERFSSSSENLRRVLRRKVFRSARHHETDPEEAEPWIDALIARFLQSEILDDTAYARIRARGLHQKGHAIRSIQANLAAKGLTSDQIEDAIEALRAEMESEHSPTEGEGLDQKAARAYARRRRLGPYRTEDQREAYRQKDLASMGRRGFDYGTAKSVIDGDNIEWD